MNLDKDKLVKIAVEIMKVFVYGGAVAVAQHFGLMGMFGM